jgi:hypothetical protein
MAYKNEPMYVDPIFESEKVDLTVDAFLMAMRHRKAYIKREAKSKALRLFWCADKEDWFYYAGHAVTLKKKILVEGMWIRKDLKQYLEYRKEEGWLFYLEKKAETNE